METLLIPIVLIAVGLAVVMSVVAWKLLREGRDRSAARVAALEDFAAAEADEAPPRTRTARDDWRLDDAGFPDEYEPVPVGARLDEGDEQDVRLDDHDDHDEVIDDDWDLAIRPHARPAAAPARQRSRTPGPRSPGKDPWARPQGSFPGVPAPEVQSAVPGDMFATAAAAGSQRPRRQGLAALATAAALLLVGTGAVYAVRSAPSLADVARRLSGPNPSSLQPLELLSLRHRSDPTGAFTVIGLVQNPVEGSSLRNIQAVVYLFDEEGRYFAGGRAEIELSSFRPGEESPFVVVVPNAGMVSRYRVGFRFEDGGVVAHVDQRGRPPQHTTDDAVSGADRGEERAPAAPHRVEG